MTFKNNRAPLLCYFKLCAAFGSHWWIQTGVTVPKHLIWVKIDNFFSRTCDLEIWRMTFKNNRAPFLCYFKLCTSFRSHWWIQTGVTVRKRLIWVQNRHFFIRVTFKLDRWPWKTIGHLFYDTLTHWGRVTHICVGKLTIIGSDNSLSPGRRQAFIWTNAGILLIEPLGTNFNEIWIAIETFSFKNMHLKISTAKWRPFCLGLNVLSFVHHFNAIAKFKLK